MLDDLQWADEDTLDLIQYLLQTNISAYKPLPLLILAAARLEFLEQHAPLTEQANVINLNPLVLDPRTVADAYPGIRSLSKETLKTLASFSKGNPYFLEELVRRVIVSTGEESVESNDDRLVRLRAQSPKTIQELLRMRLEDLPRGIRAMTLLASVSGRVFWVGALDAAIRAMSDEQSDVRLKTPSGLIDASLQDALALLMKAELAFPKVNSNYSGEQAYIFKHDLLREVAYSMLPVESCSQYHAAVGRWMLGHSEIDFKILAVDQFEMANDPNEAVIACEQAADYYNSRGAVGEAQMLLERARLIRTRAGI
jgi:predicted ATPase